MTSELLRDPGKILIVDDTPANIDVLRKFLALEGYRLSFATDGKKALDIRVVPK